MPKPPFHFVPLPKERSMRKPRSSGRTMIVDDGLPLAYTRDLVALGFEAIEISDNVVPLTDAQRRRQIRDAVAAGLVVYGEVRSTCRG